MTQTATDKATKPTAPDRTPIPCAKLIFQHSNAYGIAIPIGTEAKSEKTMPRLLACTEGGIKTEIDYMPWVRAYRVRRTQMVTRTVKDNNGKEKEVESLTPLTTYFIPEALAVWIPLDQDL